MLLKWLPMADEHSGDTHSHVDRCYVPPYFRPSDPSHSRLRNGRVPRCPRRNANLKQRGTKSLRNLGWRRAPRGVGIVEIHLAAVVTAELDEVTVIASGSDLVKEFAERRSGLVGNAVGEERVEAAARHRNSSMANCSRSSGR